MAMPAAAIVLIWKMTFSKGGFLNRLLPRTSYMGTGLAFWVLVFSYVWKNLGYTVVLWLAGVHYYRRIICRQLKVDGAGKVRIFFSICIAAAEGVHVYHYGASFLNSFKVFRRGPPGVRAYPHESMYLLQHLFNNWFVYLELDKMAAAASVSVCFWGGSFSFLEKL